MRNRIRYNVTGTLTTILIYLLLFLIQFKILYYLGNLLLGFYQAAQIFYLLFDSAVALHILNDKRNDGTYKIAYLFTIIVLPLFGSILYILSKWDLLRNTFTNLLNRSKESSRGLFIQDQEIIEDLNLRDPLAANTAKFLWGEEKYPTYRNGDMEYFSSGEAYFQALLREIKGAQHFIFMEYFILQQGSLWDQVQEILEEKIRQGVEVRLLYDGTSVITKVPLNFAKEQRKRGIKVKVFKPLVPVLSLYQNHRDHRKILVVDNQVAFTGGVNLADEYINQRTLFGHWKDSGTLTRGPSSRSFTLLFLSMWNLWEKNKEDFTPYLRTYEGDFKPREGAFITPFGDDPYGKNRVAKEVYNDIINQAVSYLHIMTPYLILDEETRSDLIHLAQCGVDVKIITPHIPDKKLVFLVTRSYYKSLLREGVRIFEYKPGFIHSKSMVSDNTKAVVGTINFDYRSLFLHFECGAYYYDRDLAQKVEKDFQETLGLSQEFTYEQTLEFSYFERAMGRILRVFAPML